MRGKIKCLDSEVRLSGGSTSEISEEYRPEGAQWHVLSLFLV